MRRARFCLLPLVGAALACSLARRPLETLRPASPTATPFAPTPTLTAEPSLAPSLTAEPSALPTSPATASPVAADEVRACAYVPGLSVPAEMPSEVLLAATPTPYPLPTPPATTAVDEPTTARQLRIYQDLWETVNREYVYPDFNGRDWQAVGAKYKRLIQAGLTDEDFYVAMNDMLSELGDEHSYFEGPREVQATNAQFAGHNDYVGIGVLHSPVPQAGRSVIVLVFPGGPAAAAGLKSHDSILAVDGEPILDERGELREVIRGPEGTTLTLTVQRPGGQPFDLSLTRARITGALPIDYCLVPGTRIGYIFLPGLDDETIPDQMRAALKALTAAGRLEGLVLDNRENAGGASTVLEEVLGFFTRGRLGEFVGRAETRSLAITPEDVGGSQAVPLVVLVGVDTVSYGEVLSGLLQATGRAQLVGQTSLGNVETMWGYSFEDGSRAWIAHETFQPLHLPNAIWEQTGIVPDVSVPTRWDLFSEANDPALAVAVKLLQPEAQPLMAQTHAWPPTSHS